MNENKKLMPKIRFKGFTDVWEKRKTKDLCSIATGKSNTQDQVEDGKYPFYIRSDKPVRSNRYLYDEEAVITIGDGNIGKVFHYVNGKFDLHQRCYKMSDFYDIKAKYFYYYFSSRFYERAMSMTAKATVDSVRLEMISDMNILFPNSIHEQEKISNYLTSLDTLIALYQHKYDKFVQIRSSLLEKMFPQSSSKVPRIRFKGFTNVWKSCMLSDFGVATGGTSIESEFSNNGIYKVISIGSYSEQSKYNDQNIRAIHSDKTKIRLLNRGDLTMLLNDKTSSGRIIGRVLFIDKSGEFVYNQRTERIEPNLEKYDASFLYHFLNAPNIRCKIIKQSQGNTQIFVNWTSIQNTEYDIPDKNEQVKLGTFFENMDQLITLYQHKINKLQNIKKILLERMFV